MVTKRNNRAIWVVTCPWSMLEYGYKEKEKNKMTTKQELVQAKISAITSVFSDYGNAVYRDTQNYNALLATQTEFSDEEITLVARQTLGM